MINFIKTHKTTADDLIKTNEVLWNDDKYMKPVEVDPWLMFGKCLKIISGIYSSYRSILSIIFF